jgi:hypothetical protein
MNQQLIRLTVEADHEVPVPRREPAPAVMQPRKPADG